MTDINKGGFRRIVCLVYVRDGLHQISLLALLCGHTYFNTVLSRWPCGDPCHRLTQKMTPPSPPPLRSQKLEAISIASKAGEST